MPGKRFVSIEADDASGMLAYAAGETIVGELPTSSAACRVAGAVRRPRASTTGLRGRALRFPFVLNGRPRGRAVGENLAAGIGESSTPREIVKVWMSSPDHRANILRNWRYGAVWSSPDFPEPGKQRNGVTVVHHFGRNLP